MAVRVEGTLFGVGDRDGLAIDEEFETMEDAQAFLDSLELDGLEGGVDVIDDSNEAVDAADVEEDGPGVDDDAGDW